MAEKINVRSPFYTFTEFNNQLTQAELTLYVYSGTKNTDKGSAKYKLTKSTTTQYYLGGTPVKGIDFEISELVRDYLDVVFDGTYKDNSSNNFYTNYNKWVTVEQLFFDNYTDTGNVTSTGTNQLIDSGASFSPALLNRYARNEATGDVSKITNVTSTTLTLEDDIFPTAGQSYIVGIKYKTDDYIAYDGYGYFEDGRNPQLDQAYLQSNNIIYRLDDHNVRVPIDTDKAVSAVFRLNGETVKSQTFTPSDESDEQVVYFNVGFNDADTFEQRVKLDGGEIETTPCLEDYFGSENVGEVDEIWVSDGDKTDILKIITEPCSKYEPYKIVFVNKFGVLQDLFFSAKSTQSINVTGETYKANTFNNNIIAIDLTAGRGHKYYTNKHQYAQYHKLGKESITLNTGFLSEEYNEVIKQLMLSEQVWMMSTKDEQVYPVVPKTQSLTYKNRVNDKLVQYVIEFDMAFDKINNIR